VIAEETGRKLETATISDLGRADKVSADKDNTTVVGGKGDTAQIKGRIEQIRIEIDKSTSDYDKEKLQERLAKLSGGVAIIRVGAATETELKEKKARIEDALHATRAALEEGIVPGGGVALIRAASALDNLKVIGDEQVGVDIIREAITAPLRQIAANAGHNPGVVLHKVREKSGSFGFNADSGEYTDLMKDGVIDPTKVVRCALENGSSVARVLLSTEVCITEKPKGKDDAHDHGPPGGEEDMDY